MLKDMRITHKLPLVMIIFALISALTTGVVAYYHAVEAIEDQAESKLYALLESRKSSLDHYFDTIQRDIVYHSNSHLVKRALRDFGQAWEQLPDDKMTYLQTQYITLNPFPKGREASLLRAEDGSLYSTSHEENHADFTAFIEAGAFYDVFLINKRGDVIYTAKKENDFATNLKDGPWSNSGLADVFNKVIEHPSSTLRFSDFSPHTPSQNAPAGFIATAVTDDDSQLLGVFVVQLSIEKLDKVMHVQAGMGNTGETYLVGKDHLMRSNSRFFEGRSILQIEVNTSPVNSALKGEEGVTVALDYRNERVFSAYKPFDVMGHRWAILAEVDEYEVLEPVFELNRLLLLAGGIIATAIALVGYLLSADLSSPIMSMTEAMKKLAKNDLSVNISVNQRKDEVGSMALALIEFKNFAIEREALRERLSHMAKHDTLTGLPNRDYIMSYISDTLAEDEQRGLTAMFADLDGFKKVNDDLGHQAGDELLRQVSERLKHSVREGDVVGRIGGDEFVIILPDVIHETEAENIAHKILQSVKQPYQIEGDQAHVGISIGAASYPNHTDDLDELLKIADAAMYHSKRTGKHRFVYHVS
ncbi:diguanylate cyclase domain-containing protein [Marinomonas mediterranea]|uniref:Diguanylate cyclase n=1 Tax=Marinomonas mediterranea (strain ATCC 700492 / JCM 21426 / NBRC 103028 / MMB-1) TaxID=717774 RepID=F2JUZ9_MARM1|nr:diguanylate cyclase [Marinomonas mediterranea]ADZ91653.1 diguanylate cyclase [Marinomonas mediterranea MMB-1]WCN17754.1 diguanylate cyclase [Marinomonas mediterranea MMB-1]